MSYRVDMLEATLDHIDEAVVVIDSDSNVLFWNKAAAGITGYDPPDVLAHPCPELYTVTSKPIDPGSDRPSSTTLNHRSGYTVPAMLRVIHMRNSAGEYSGKALLFYPTEKLDSVQPDASGSADVERSHLEMSDRLEAAHHQWRIGSIPFSILRITVDQAESLRTTHGCDACESMLRTVQQTLSRQMKPAEIIGRWGTSEFLVLAHERTSDLLVEHARRLAGVARTADFRWWGDRVGLTVSIGAASVAEGHTLRSLLDEALQAMHSAMYAGGNQVIQARAL
jgi:diguanylate cyclase (GGDEF)-like protein/PAS domain S-box-containing protein